MRHHNSKSKSGGSVEWLFPRRTQKIMASRDRDQSAPHHHQPLLSSLVVRPSNSEGGAGSGTGGGSGGRGGDYEPGEVHRDPLPPYSRSDRYSDDPALMLPARTWALRKACCYECSLGP